MRHSTFAGCSILVVEDEPFIAMAITEALERAGAVVTSVRTHRHALMAIEQAGPSAAILDHALGDGDASQLYSHLNERSIPFLVYSGCDKARLQDVPHVSKPASIDQLLASLEDLLKGASVTE